MSFEGLAGAICGFLILGEVLTLIEIGGCVLVSVSFIISAEEWGAMEAKRWVGRLFERCGFHQSLYSGDQAMLNEGKGKRNGNEVGMELSHLPLSPPNIDSNTGASADAEQEQAPLLSV